MFLLCDKDKEEGKIRLCFGNKETEKEQPHQSIAIDPLEDQNSGFLRDHGIINIRADESDSGNHSEIYSNFKPDVEELEMLLEAYFAQIDGILQKISGMSEYVDDTEDFINIMLDDKQNQLLQMGVMLSTANMILNAGIVVVGLFVMNIAISLFDGEPTQFWETVCGTVAGCVVFYLIAIAWGKKKKFIAL